MSNETEQPIDDNLSFEQQIKELEEVVNEMDKGDVPLEVLVASFERGLKLRLRLEEMLNAAELKVEELLNENGDQRTPFNKEKAE